MDGKRGGRSPGTRNRRTLELLGLAEEGETPCAYALRVMRDETVAPDVRMNAARLAAPFVHTKPQPEPRFVSFTVPEEFDGAAALLSVHANLLRATAAGEIALEDAKDLSAMLDGHRRLVETVELEERIANLERQAQ
jgi:hypothetical protein